MMEFGDGFVPLKEFSDTRMKWWRYFVDDRSANLRQQVIRLSQGERNEGGSAGGATAVCTDPCRCLYQNARWQNGNPGHQRNQFPQRAEHHRGSTNEAHHCGTLGDTALRESVTDLLAHSAVLR